MRYQTALEYIYSFSNFEMTGIFTTDDGAKQRRFRALIAALGDPHLAYATTHIAGTKGKGSTAVMVATALTASGMRTGLYSQPDLHTFRERIQIDGVPISEETLAALVPTLQAAVARLDPDDAQHLITYEVGTALAFMAFAQAHVQHAVIEVGLGGRLDATNIIQPLVGVITSISLDHMEILGSTITAIAREKAGIIKPGMAVVTSAQHPDALAVITATCATQSVPLLRVGPLGSDAEYTYDATPPARFVETSDLLSPPFTVITPDGTRSVQLGLLGGHQRQNATAAIAALDQLRLRGVAVTESGIVAGLRSAQWPARVDVVGTRPWLIVDGAHNADSMEQLMAALRDLFAFQRLHLVIGVMRDKDAAGIAAAIATLGERLGTLIATQGTSPRALPATELAAYFATDAAIVIQPVLDQALAEALAIASPDDLICVTGSLHLAGAALRWIKAHVADPLAEKISIAGSDH